MVGTSVEVGVVTDLHRKVGADFGEGKDAFLLELVVELQYLRGWSGVGEDFLQILAN